MLAYAVLRLRGHDRTRAAALVLRYRAGAQLVPAYVRSVERWLANGGPVTSATAMSQGKPSTRSGPQPETDVADNPRAQPPFGTPLTMTVRLVAGIQNRLFWRIGSGRAR